jgi:hypothetical protein
MRLLIGSILAALGMFFWGFAYWAGGIGDPFTHISPEAEAAISTTLKTQLQTHGLYMIPDPKNGTMEESNARFAAGPYAMIHFRPTGIQMGDPATMGVGFLHMLLSALLLAIVLKLAVDFRPPSYGEAPGYVAVLKLGALIGLLATVFTNFSQPIWWHVAWDVAFKFAAFDLVSYLIAAAILAHFVRPPAAK